MTSTKNKNAVDASVASYASYLSLSNASEKLKSRKMEIASKDVVSINISNALEAIITARSNDLLIAFTGTNDISDILEDLNASPINENGVIYHRGFFNATKPFLEVLTEPLRTWRNKNPDAQLLLTGHSLGGAIATIIGIQLSNMGIKVDGVYTFGTPGCIGDYKKSLKINYIQENYVNLDDKIPWLFNPLYSSSSGLPGSYYELGNDNSVIKRDSGWNLSSEKSNYSEGPEPVEGISNIVGHSMARYMNIMIRGDQIIEEVIKAMVNSEVRHIDTLDQLSPEERARDEAVMKELKKVFPNSESSAR